MAIKKTTATSAAKKDDRCAKCDAKIAELEKNILNLEKKINALAKQEVQASDPRVSRLISVLRDCVPKFQKKW